MHMLFLSKTPLLSQTAIATHFASLLKTDCLSNSPTAITNEHSIALDPFDEFVPYDYSCRDSLVFDFHLNLSHPAPVISHAVDIGEVIIITTRADIQSLVEAKDLYDGLLFTGMPIVFIIHSFKKWEHYIMAKQWLNATADPSFAIPIRQLEWLEERSGRQDYHPTIIRPEFSCIENDYFHFLYSDIFDYVDRQKVELMTRIPEHE